MFFEKGPTGFNYINGVWRFSTADGQFESRNPTDFNDVIGTFQKTGKSQVEEVVHAARTAFKPWRDLKLVKRAEYMERFLDLLKKHTECLAQLVTRESGKQINEARADVIEAIHMAQYAFSVGIIGKEGEVINLEISEKDAFSRYRPRGVVVCITPWNFPIAIPLWEMGLALAFGNTVIFKPSEETPACGEAIAQLMHEAGFPSGVFNLLQGDGSTGWELVCNPDTNVILFTGSWAVGNKIKQEVARHYNKVCTIETGSKSAVIILDDCIPDLALNAGILSGYKTAGQRCVSGSRIIVEEGRYDWYSQAFSEIAKRIRVGDPFDESTFYGPMINKKAVQKGESFNERARARFHVILDRNNEPPPTENGCWLMPFAYEACWKAPDDVLQDEPFAPHVALIRAESLEDAVRIYNDTLYGLSAAVVTEDYRKARWAEENLDCGIFYWNLPCIGADVRLPFGGVKQSGNLTPSAAGIIPVITHCVAATYNRGTEIKMAQGLSAKV